MVRGWYGGGRVTYGGWVRAALDLGFCSYCYLLTLTEAKEFAKVHTATLHGDMETWSITCIIETCSSSNTCIHKHINS
jgi:hypothetical protein